MTTDVAKFDSDGYVVIDDVLSEEAIVAIEGQLEKDNGGAGTRNLLNNPWCSHIAQALAAHQLISILLPKPGVAVQCTYFRKSLARNWLVPLHQDIVIPLATRFAATGWSMWSIKEGCELR